MRKALTLAMIAIAIGIVAPVILVASDDNPPEPWYPPMKDTTGTYVEIELDPGVWYWTLKCPAEGETRCQIYRAEPVHLWDPDGIGWFLSDENYYYFYAEEEDGVVTNASDGTLIMIVPKQFLDE